MAKRRTYWKRVNSNGSVTEFTRNRITGTVTTRTTSADDVRRKKDRRKRIIRIIIGLLFVTAPFGAETTDFLTAVICILIGLLFFLWALWPYLWALYKVIQEKRTLK